MAAMNPNIFQERTMKVELAGDAFCGTTFPKIRLQGKWLANLGFKPTGHVLVVLSAPGELSVKYIKPI